MNIEKFIYKGKPRVVAVLKRSPTYIEGFDLGNIEDPKEISESQKLCESIEHNETDRLPEEDYAKVHYLMRHFRRFKISDIQKGRLT